MHIADVIPNEDVLLELEPDELGLWLLPVLASSHPMSTKHLGELLRMASAHYRDKEQVDTALREAWAWLEGQGLLIPSRQYPGSEIRVLSRRARRLAQEADPRRALSGRRLPKDSLHSRIREEVWSLFHRGKYDTAVFEAMKALEIAVREASGLSAADIGKDLMRTAFDISGGPLTDMATERAERQARSDLFGGAIGSYKNPHSHRNVALDDPKEAAEIIMLANHLLRIVDTRSKAKIIR
jgi:uncharacterized protein (TIGR02391 family)